MLDRLIKKLGGFTKREMEAVADWMIEILELKQQKAKPSKKEIEEYVKELSQKGWKAEKERLLTSCVDHLFKGVTLKDLNESYNTLTKAQKEQLQIQANDLQDMWLWEWMHEEMMKVTQRKMYLESKNEDDIIFAKACMYMEDIRMRKVQKLALMK